MRKWHQLKNNKIVLGIVVLIFAAIAGWAYYAYSNRVMPQSAIYFLNDVHSPQKGDKILVFSPHPDDETIAAGAYIYDAEKAGAEVKIVLVTDGNKRGLKDTRYTEFRKVAADLGVKSSDLVFLGHQDGSLSSVDQKVLSGEFQDQINSFEPNVVFFPYIKDQHPDHAYTGQVAENVSDSSTSVVFQYQYLVHANYFPQPQTYHPDEYLLPPLKYVTFDKEWERYMVSSATEVALKAAGENYQSQMKNPLIRELFYSMIRRNELFAIDSKDN